MDEQRGDLPDSRLFRRLVQHGVKLANKIYCDDIGEIFFTADPRAQMIHIDPIDLGLRHTCSPTVSPTPVV